MMLYYSINNDIDNMRNILIELCQSSNIVQSRFYKAILEKNWKLLGFTLRERLLKLYLQGRIKRAVKFAKKYGLFFLLHKISLISKKSIRLLNHIEIEKVLKLKNTKVAVLYILRKSPKLKIGSRTMYLKYNNKCINLIRLLIRRSIPLYTVDKSALSYIQKTLGSIIDKKNGVLLVKVKVHSDFEELKHLFEIANKIKL
ncbi:MAG: hypothetical protein RMJ38_05785 [candidate division WOR-3 bacterium]|nr:hypothetical protein [candidate division WOR-3 bacterium]MDW8150934.1 hypothetical protein [candidate division WOR-3 bacterium]